MYNLKYWKEKIKQTRKQTSFRDFVKEIASWYPVVLSRNSGQISKFPSSSRIGIVIHHSEYEKNRDGLLNPSYQYDEKKSFFENFQSFMVGQPIFNVIAYGGSENSDFGDMILNSKNCYLSSTVIYGGENVAYSFSVKDNCRNIYNSVSVYQHSDSIYWSTGVVQSYNIFYSKFINNSSNIWFSSNLTGCSECLFCSNLENASFCIDNTPYEKEVYEKKKQELLKEKDTFLGYYKQVEKV